MVGVWLFALLDILTKYQPILCYLNLIRETFLHLMGGNSDLLSLVDGVSVRLLMSCTPKVSDIDLKFLDGRMNPETYDTGLQISEAGARDEMLFRDIEDPYLRRNIWERLRNIDYPIPTLETFFKDRLWLEVGQNVMQQLLITDPNPDRRVTIDEGIGGLYNVSIPMTIPFRQDRIRDQLYELWRFSLQYGFEMTGPIYRRRLPRAARGTQRQPIPGLSPRSNGPDQSVLWQHFFWLAREQNFNVSVAEGIPIGPADLPSIMACDYPENSEEDVAMGRRRGKPYTDSAEADRYALSQVSLAEPWLVRRSTANSVTAGFVRRSVFEAFFGYLKGGSSEWPTVDSPSTGLGIAPGIDFLGGDNMLVGESSTQMPFQNNTGSAPPVLSTEQFETPTAMQLDNFRPSIINLRFFFLDQPGENRRMPYLEPIMMNPFFERLSTKFTISDPGRNNRTLPGGACYAHYGSNTFSPLHATWRHYVPTGSEEQEQNYRKRRREGGLDEMRQARTWLENELRDLEEQQGASYVRALDIVEEEI